MNALLNFDPFEGPDVPVPDENGCFTTPAEGAKFMASFGIPQILLRGKAPFTPGWIDKGTTDFGQIDAWYAEFKCNFGSIAKRSLDGHFVLEVDSLDVRARYRRENPGFDFTPSLLVISGEGRGHRWYRFDENSLDLQNIGQDDAAGFSLRVHNEQCVSPGSIHPVRNTQYRVAPNSTTPKVASPQEIAWFKSKKNQSREIKKAQEDGQPISEGSRNITLTSIGGKLRQDGLNQEEILAVLTRKNEECCTPPLDQSEIETISRSVSRYPIGNPNVVLHGGIPAGINPDVLSKANAEQRGTPVDAVGVTESGIPVFAYPKGEDESFEDPMSIADMENRSDLTVEYPNPGVDDLVSLFADNLVSGTSLPLAYARETLKNLTNQLIDGYFIHPAYPTLSLRGFHFNYGPSWIGKTTAFDLAMGWMKSEFAKRGIWMRDLLSYGSRQFFVRMLSREVPLGKDGKPKWKAGNPLQFLHVKEGNRIAADTQDKYFKSVFSLITDLYDQTEASTGSFSNDEWVASGVKVSSIINITPSDFRTAFEGKGAIGGGGLGRWTIVAPPKIENKKDWDKMSAEELWATFEPLRARLPVVAEKLLASSPAVVTTQPIVLTEEDGAKEIRLATHNRMEEAGKRGVRLTEYFIREQVNRAVFSLVHPNVMTKADAERIAAWTDAQLAARAMWPVDAGNPVERHEVTIRRTVIHHLISETKLKDACHYYRPGSGGLWAFDTAVANMLRSEIKCVGVAGQRRTPVFCPRWCKDHPRVKI